MAASPHSVGDILDRLEELAEENERVSLEAAIEAAGQRSYGPLLLVPALIDISPVGSVPGLPTVLGTIIFLVAVQILIGRKHLWLPRFLAERSASRHRVRKVSARLRGPAKFLDRLFHGRLLALTKGPFVRAAAIFCMLLALTVPPLEIIPLATTAPMAAIAAFGLALLVRDGLLMIVAAILSVIAVGAGLSLVSIE